MNKPVQMIRARVAQQRRATAADSHKDMVSDIIERIQEINPRRSMPNMGRRIQKLFEEGGELSEAHLEVTSEENYKEKTIDDILEEAVDAMIVAIDIGLTKPDALKHLTDLQMRVRFREMFEKKMAKWSKKLKAKQDSTLSEKV